MKQILVIGSTGFLGQNFKNLTPPSWAEPFFSNRKIVDLGLDFSNSLAAHLRENNYDSAIITAAIASPDECRKHPEFSHQVNVTGTTQLFKLLKEFGVKPVFFSTDHVYDGIKGAYDETDSYHPITMYGRQKVEAEIFLRENFSDYLILRTSKQVSTYIAPKNILSEMALKLKSGENIRCATDQWVAPAFVEDIVALTWKAIESKLSGPYHIAPAKEYSRLELGVICADQLDFDRKQVIPCSIKDFQFAEVRPPRCTLNGGKIVSALKYKMMSLEEGLQKLRPSIFN